MFYLISARIAKAKWLICARSTMAEKCRYYVFEDSWLPLSKHFALPRGIGVKRDSKVANLARQFPQVICWKEKSLQKKEIIFSAQIKISAKQ